LYHLQYTCYFLTEKKTREKATQEAQKSRKIPMEKFLKKEESQALSIFHEQRCSR